MTLPSARQMSGRAKKAHPGLGACQSEKQELELARSLCASGSISGMVRQLCTRVREKSYDCRRMADYAGRKRCRIAKSCSRVSQHVFYCATHGFGTRRAVLVSPLLRELGAPARRGFLSLGGSGRNSTVREKIMLRAVQLPTTW